MMYDKKREYIQARRDEELDGIGNLMQLYKINGRDVMGNYSAPPMGMSNRLTVVLQQELH